MFTRRRYTLQAALVWIGVIGTLVGYGMYRVGEMIVEWVMG